MTITLILIGLVILDIFDREWVEYRAYMRRKHAAWQEQLNQLQKETRIGSDTAVLERLNKISYEAPATQEHIDAPETPFISQPLSNN